MGKHFWALVPIIIVALMIAVAACGGDDEGDIGGVEVDLDPTGTVAAARECPSELANPTATAEDEADNGDSEDDDEGGSNQAGVGIGENGVDCVTPSATADSGDDNGGDSDSGEEDEDDSGSGIGY